MLLNVWSEKTLLIAAFLLAMTIQRSDGALSMKQFQQSLDMMRKTCLPKSGASESAINGLKTGNFPDDDKPLKCYAYCVLEMSGILTKKKEFNEAKVKTQAELMLPAELKEGTLRAWEACKAVSKNYKDHCDRVYYTIKCNYEFDPPNFRFA